MCHSCGMEMTNVNDEKLEDTNSSQLDTAGSCGEKELEAIKHDVSSLHTTSMISPMRSLSSCNSYMSSFSDYSVDANTCDRANEENLNHSLDAQLHKSNQEYSLNGVERLHTLMENFNESNCGNDSCRGTNTETEQPNRGQESRNECSGITDSAETVNSDSVDHEMDLEIWDPPGPEDPEDDIEGRVACNDDDDDECCDSSEWGRPSSLSFFRDEGSGSYKFKEEKQKVMKEVINGKFKVFVSQLLKSVGVISSGQDGESWVDIVTSLSWEAASFLKPDAIDGKAMDPNGYVKVKCIAAGSRNESRLVKGLVFKKHAAHKHMPTTYKNPTLLLIRGVLGLSSSGLSSFKSMEEQVNDYLKSVMEMIELCHPNVVLVEKTVSRDIQESILKKGMTLVLDMKLHRLERIARCTGSPILSSDTLMSQKLKQCSSIYFEKFVEEHASFTEGGKRPSKTLMFIEGCPTRLGCTVLLKGTHSDELKRIKCVVQCAVVMAYHLILETSFLVDQRAMFSTSPFVAVSDVMSPDDLSPNLVSSNSSAPQLEESNDKSIPSTVDIPISDGFSEKGSDYENMELEGNLTISYEPYNPAIFTGFSSLSDSLKKAIGGFPLASYQSLSSYFGFHGEDPNSQMTEAVSTSTTRKAVDHYDRTTPEAVDHYDKDTRGSSDEENSVECGQSQSLPGFSESLKEVVKTRSSAEDQMQSKDESNATLDSQSILVLMSSRNALRGTMCEQSHFSHIMFYKNFDVPLGRFLRENLLNKRNQCRVCGELPEAHCYYYAHHNKQLTIQVKQLSGGKRLPGEKEGKLWMWSRCGSCRSSKGTSKSTKRVLISTAARGLSFGKFLELSFSHHALSKKLSSCGHSLYRDFLYFFGLGSMVAMFKYSEVATYSVSVPPHKMEFSNPIRQERLIKEIDNVYMKGRLLFTEIADSLKKIRSQFDNSTLRLKGSLNELCVVEKMLQQEKSEFEMNFHNALSENGNSGQAVYKFLSLNRLLWELLLESCIWDRRLNSLMSPGSSIFSGSAVQMKVNGFVGRANEESGLVIQNGVVGDNTANSTKLDKSVEANGFPIKEIPVEGSVEESSGVSANTTAVAEVIDTLVRYNSSPNGNGFNNSHSDGDNSQDEGFPSSSHLQVQRDIPILADDENYGSVSNLGESKEGASGKPLSFKLENSNEWFWMPFSEITQIHMNDIHRIYLPKFDSISSYTPGYMPTAYQLITQEGPRLHIPLATDDYVVSDHETELSSIVACVLALMKDLPQSEIHDKDSNGEGGFGARSIESLHSISRNPSNGSSESDSVYFNPSISSEESRFSSFDGLNLLDSLVSDNFKPADHEGIVKTLGKGKYLVNCPYFVQFRDLRSHCCPSELHYIASLSRCKNWDAQGGKSKSFFAKTLDDRFIIKEIKKTEYDSFMKFAPDYFKYMNQSFELGNQTCLAKVLGIYQVTVRQSRSGKEMRHDLMVMENLIFGRNISRQYDLKGALHARYNSVANGSADVLLDQNFVNDMNSSPLYVSNTAKRLLQRAVWNDTSFLNSINVMDYSLLVGVDTEKRELVCGIIDYLRQYTWDKHLETWVKSSLVPKNVLPTVISPKEYKRRFRKFMSTHFLSVPDHWCSQRTSDSCQLCGVKEEVQNEFSS